MSITFENFMHNLKSCHLYNYCSNNPVRYIDPDGRYIPIMIPVNSISRISMEYEDLIKMHISMNKEFNQSKVSIGQKVINFFNSKSASVTNAVTASDTLMKIVEGTSKVSGNVLKVFGKAGAAVALYQTFFPNQIELAWNNFNNAYADIEELKLSGKEITGMYLENIVKYDKTSGIAAGGIPFLKIDIVETKQIRVHVEGEKDDRIYPIDKQKRLYRYYHNVIFYGD